MLIVGLLLGTLFMVFTIGFLADVGAKYGYNVDNTTTELETLNKIDETRELSASIESRATSINQTSGALDLLGGLAQSGVSTLTLMKNSVGIVGSMTNEGLKRLPLPDGLANHTLLIIMAIMTVLVTFLIIGILVRTKL